MNIQSIIEGLLFDMFSKKDARRIDDPEKKRLSIKIQDVDGVVHSHESSFEQKGDLMKQKIIERSFKNELSNSDPSGMKSSNLEEDDVPLAKHFSFNPKNTPSQNILELAPPLEKKKDFEIDQKDLICWVYLLTKDPGFTNLI